MVRRATVSSNHANLYAGASHSGGAHADQGVSSADKSESRAQESMWGDIVDDMECPLCLEEIDISDANFKPCPCGYQNLNGRCPACRRKYTDQTIEFKAMTTEEYVCELAYIRIMRLTNAKKNKEREKKEMEATSRKHLANMRVVQKNLVYVVGLSPRFAREEFIPTLKSVDYFGQYGRVSKILISKRVTNHKFGNGSQDTSIGMYVTYQSKEDAARAIVAIDGSKEPGGRIIRASYGTTKYCTAYLRNLPCSNPGCTYLHEPGEEADSFTKEDLSTLRHAAKDTEHKIKPASMLLQPIVSKKSYEQLGSPSTAPATPATPAPFVLPPVASPTQHADPELSALPRTAAWASGKPVPPGMHADAVSLEFSSLASAKAGKQQNRTEHDSPSPAEKEVQQEATDTEHEADQEPKTPEDQVVPASSYRPSHNAQVLLDDLHKRRMGSSDEPAVFTDFDWTLSTLHDGDFSLNLPALPEPSQTSTRHVWEEHDSFYTPYKGSFNPFDTDPLEQTWPAPFVDSGAPSPGYLARGDLSETLQLRKELQMRASMQPMPSQRIAFDDADIAPEEQRSAAAALLASRARRLQEAGETPDMPGDVRGKMPRQQLAASGDSQSLLALLRRIQEHPGEEVRAGPVPHARVRPPGLEERRAPMQGAHMEQRGEMQSFSPPGLTPIAGNPNVGTGLLLAQLLGNPGAKPADAYSPPVHRV
ncbi:RING-type E3 ubiquitin transferase [Malassezia vespertilionis]|uniref:RING-type E3 ubiquitin transferase n=1 Tax=Malassezia vespertilionis TaxID=2020962 RepID=UPI0024B21B41|nr:RING-type E3 ubiquitin transferase [Malassezia vespertilionis]WFD05996.1 RING-type E3 ubiquitin transferase [Malassezia vespertilionis]